MAKSNKYTRLADKFLPTIKAVCAEEDTPFQVCFAQLVVESGGKSDLAKLHNYFGIKYPRGRHADELILRLGNPGSFTKLTPERLKIKNQAHLDKLLKKGAKFSDEYLAAPYFGKSVRLKLPCAFCTWKTMEAGVRGWAVFMQRSRYDDGGVLRDDPVRWIAYRWMRGYATSNQYVEAVVNRMNKVAKYTGDESFAVEITEELDDLLDEARLLGPGRDRWDLGKLALETNEMTGTPYELIEFEPMEITVSARELAHATSR